jgi:hypothetical protein
MQVKDHVILAGYSNPGTVTGPATTSADAPIAGLTSQNTVTAGHLASSHVTEPCALDVHSAVAAARESLCAIICAETTDMPPLSPAQEAGEECAYCYRRDPEIYVGEGRQGPVYACPGCAADQFGLAEGLHWQTAREFDQTDLEESRP